MIYFGFRTNGEQRLNRRIERDSYNTWLMQQRDRDLAQADAEER